MTEVNDHLKLLFAARHLYCQVAASQCSATRSLRSLNRSASAPPLGDRLLRSHSMIRPANLPEKNCARCCRRRAMRFVETADKRAKALTVIQDRFRVGCRLRANLEALEAALHAGVVALPCMRWTMRKRHWRWRFSLDCAECASAYLGSTAWLLLLQLPLGATDSARALVA
jgi:hypothetical protein